MTMDVSNPTHTPTPPARRPWALAAVSAVAAVALVWSAAQHGVGAQPVGSAAPAPAAAAPRVTGLPDFTVLVEEVGPSVVNIRTVERVRRDESMGDDVEEQMREFFRRFGIPLPPGAVPRGPQGPDRVPEQRQRGVGSGFIYSADGFILTNAHVVDGAEEVIVTLPDKREFKARVVGFDRRTDVAVVKIDATGLKPVRIGDVERLKVGEWVMAIGSPFGLDNTVTAGIVSAKQRDTGDFLPFIQTDVAINPGNSGGPLINMRGEVVGINSQIYSRSGGFMGISFAIPIDEAVRVAEQLKATGKVTRGRIGVAIEPVDKELAESLGLPKAIGALVRGVEDGSPAAKAGIEPGDIILRFDGKPIEKSADLPRIVGNTKPGTRAAVEVWRRGATKTLTLTVGTFEEETAAAPAEPKVAKAGPLGLTVRELTADERRERKVAGGVFVAEVGGPAAAAGVRAGDVIVGVGNQSVAGVREFERAVADWPKGRPVTLLIRRGDWAQWVLVRP
ncbi:DegQ family serine endoprotease [uncultured Azonexus sp.]|uniref:Probable periplasmic serine endoprotease DegP-like n=2 Tax=Tepidimonas taiwanensis TaxID=307486 RepID=A0A554XEF9_9BURK|nr:DegQ family serine endoprotease [uncultured Azonexus sp.]TSE34179.1 putative serine protease HtrA [Tepidimonas taiwanensis]